VLQHQARFGPSHAPLPDLSVVTSLRYEDIDSAAEARTPRSLYGTILLVLRSDRHHVLPLLRRRADSDHGKDASDGDT
jgi:hypothetical protein